MQSEEECDGKLDVIYVVGIERRWKDDEGTRGIDERKEKRTSQVKSSVTGASLNLGGQNSVSA
jgi:hypothetical protein